jgi:nondiscriminating glutamyl-tRNA synthetase
MSVRTRFAPSPTGLLHLGNVRVAIFNWLFARHHGGSFVLRLEDTDTERNVAGAEGSLMRDLRWLGAEWDEGPDVGGPHAPYRQSERGPVYARAVDRLLASGAAFRCFCEEGAGDEGGYARYPGTCRSLDRARAEARADGGEAHVVRFRSPLEGEVVIQDAVRGAVTVQATEIDDFVLRRGDGRVTYNFAVVADDVDMEITHVIRGAGHLSNTPRQALLFDALDAPRPVFAHLPTVLDPAGGKLSKRAGATSVASYREAGYPPEGLVNYLSLLGWSDPAGEEILTPDELAARISLDRVGASDTAYDPEKLRWVSAQHLARRDLADIVEGVRPYLDMERLGLTDATLRSVVEALHTRLCALGDIGDLLALVLPGDAEAARGRARLAGSEGTSEVITAVGRRLEALPAWEPDAIGAAVREGGKDVGARGPALFHPVRLAVTGEETGPDLARILHVLGRARVMDRLTRAEGPPAV